MTPDEYRAIVRAMGLTPVKPSYDGATLHVDREGLHSSIPDPESLSIEERQGMIAIIKSRMQIEDH